MQKTRIPLSRKIYRTAMQVPHVSIGVIRPSGLMQPNEKVEVRNEAHGLLIRVQGSGGAHVAGPALQCNKPMFAATQKAVSR
jgi:hypothetical protein